MNLKSFAKVNLFLKVLNKRPDNYHNVETVFERINLFDSLVLKLRKDGGIAIICDNRDVPAGEENLCFKAARLLKEETGCKKGVSIKITKRIPLGAGLGGGSSNAAVVLLGLNRLWGLNLPRSRLVRIAARIGSDVAFFIYDTTFALGKGRGDKISILSNLNKIKLWHILVIPRVRVLTPLIYGKFSSFSKLTRSSCNVKILTSVLAKNGLSKGRPLFNSLESVTFKVYPQVRIVKDALIGLGLKNTLMSGSGCSVFSIVSGRKEALNAVKAVKKLGKGWLALAVSSA